MKNSYWRR